MSQVARVEKFEKIMLGHPQVSLYLQKPLWGPQGYKSGGGPLDFGFLAKNHLFPSGYAY